MPWYDSEPESYFLFMLAYFSPFSADHDINFEGGNLEDIFDTKIFSLLSINVMQNWEAVHECEDAREKERICKQGSSQKKSSQLRKEQGDGLPNDYLQDPDSFEVVLSDILKSRKDSDSLAMEAILTGANWFSYQGASDSSSNRDVPLSHGQEKYLFHCLKLWQDEIKQAEQMISHARCARDDPHNQIVMKDVCQETSNSVNLEQISTGDGLPPHLDLYIGAPVVLRNRNLSQELRITNGAQGIVRGIFSEE